MPLSTTSLLKQAVPNIQYSFSSKRLGLKEIKITGGGFYIANKFDSSIVKLNRGLPPDRKMDLASFVQSKFSSDRGLNWQQLPIPTLLSPNDRQFCELAASCRLHVHLFRNKGIPGLYSRKNAPGLVVANGNLGSYLSWRNKDLSTYVSEDAGVSWRQISILPGVFAITKEGLLVFAVARTRTSLFSYSWDAGRTWTTRQFVQGTGIYLRKLKPTIKKSISGQLTAELRIFGATSNKRYGLSRASGVMIEATFNLTAEVRKCSGVDSVDSKSTSDYEHFYPINTNDRLCTLNLT